MTPIHSGRPSATLRLQLHAAYTLDDARSDLPYFARLGVTHLYLSPVSQSRPGSTHGYDVVDHGKVDEARGGEPALRRLAQDARQAGLGLLLDIVPNHMSTDPANGWWWEVLTLGRGSRKASWFDVDWDAPQLSGKVLAPFLARPYEESLNAGELALQHHTQLGLHVAVQGRPYPLSPESLAQLGLPPDDARKAMGATQIQQIIAAHDPANPEGRKRLHVVLELQHYRLAWWRDAAHAINWRRFFEVSELIGLRVENDVVFDAVHALPLRLYAEGVIDGLRIDHVDGLAQPLDYCRKLRSAMQNVENQRPPELRQVCPWVVVEKILAPGESLDQRWAVSGTTGYDFAADVGALQHSESGERPLRQAWAEIAQDPRPPKKWLHQARQEMLDRHFIAERCNLLRSLQENRGQRNGGQTPISVALDALLRCFPTYRTYVEGGEREGQDRVWFGKAMEEAAAQLAEMGDAQAEGLLPWLDEMLGGKAVESAEGRLTLRRFQQLTPPLAAKSLEDTVFYRYGCLLSRNEVGSDPAVFAITVQGFHKANQLRCSLMPESLLATATHDHKRGEDGRARLAVLSELPQLWVQQSRAWMELGRAHVPLGPHTKAFHYMLLQTLVAAWPPQLSAHDAAGVQAMLRRVGEWTVKALREGKQLSHWFEPQTEHEQAWLHYLDALQPGGAQHRVLQEIERLVQRLEPGAILNSLVQTALRLTSPGIPDLYQGTEWRDFSLVDPDNRRPVDYSARLRSLMHFIEGRARNSTPLSPLTPHVWEAEAWTDGRVKQALIAALLALRKDCPAAFTGDYQPLPAKGAKAHKVVAFSRNKEIIVVAAVKCAAQAVFDDAGMPRLPDGYWESTSLSLPEGNSAWRDVLATRPLKPTNGSLPLAQVLSSMPVAVLRRDQG